MMEFVSWGYSSQLNAKIKNVPNHQPVLLYLGRQTWLFHSSRNLVFTVTRRATFSHSIPKGESAAWENGGIWGSYLKQYIVNSKYMEYIIRNNIYDNPFMMEINVDIYIFIVIMDMEITYRYGNLWITYLYHGNHMLYHLVMTNSSPWKDPPIFRFGKLSREYGCHIYWFLCHYVHWLVVQ